MTDAALQSGTARIREVARTDEGEARRLVGALITRLFAIPVEDVEINRDQYSLNSLNGFLTSGGEPYFFKFHQEEGEEAMAGEYYRADILATAGLPIDLPVYKSTLPGEQILLYRRRSDPRFSDVLNRLDRAPDEDAAQKAIEAETGLNRQIARVYLQSLHPITPQQAAGEPVNRLFQERMIDPVGRRPPGGRYRQFYIDQPFEFPGVRLDWSDFSRARIVFRGIPYQKTVGALFEEALHLLDPRNLAGAGGVTAHGDAHNANVWYIERGDAPPALSFFDPAFAGSHMPALIAEVKATFHNCLAHPFWLYEPQEATRRFVVDAAWDGETLRIGTDWDMTSLRRRLLEVKADEVWRPLLSALGARGLLPANWRSIVRAALFLCPTLVMNLRAGAATHSAASSAIAFGVAVMAGSPPLAEQDVMSDFFDRIDPAGSGS
jgi:hypothetical protein